MRPFTLPRNLLRLCLNIFPSPSMRSPFQTTRPPKKHIKIDDEEQQTDPSDCDPTYIYHHHYRLAHMIRQLLYLLFSLILLLLLLAYTIYKPPKLLISLFAWKNPDVLFEVPLPSSRRVVALTIDDAPSSETPKILDLLKEYDAHATFFIIGKQISSHPGLLHAMRHAGHEVGNHAWADEPSFLLPLSELKKQVKEVDELLPRNSDGARYFRPGSGVFNRKMVQMLKGVGYRVVLGGIYPHDPQIHRPKVNAKHVLSMVRPGGIIIMHDRRDYSPEQLELVLKGLKEGGWRVESVGGLLRIAEEEAGGGKGG